MKYQSRDADVCRAIVWRPFVLPSNVCDVEVVDAKYLQRCVKCTVVREGGGYQGKGGEWEWGAIVGKARPG